MKTEYEYLIKNKNVKEYYEMLNFLNNTISQDGGILNLIVNQNELKQQYGGSIIDDIKNILNIIAGTDKVGLFKYKQELDDFSDFLKERLTSALNPVNIKDTLSFSFMPVKLINGKMIVDRDNKLVNIFCNFIRKLVKSRQDNSNDDIIDDYSDSLKVIDNLGEITIGIFNDLLILFNKISLYIAQQQKGNLNTNQNTNDEETDENSKQNNEQDGGCIFAGVDTAICLGFVGIVAIVFLATLTLLIILAIVIIVGIVILLCVFAPTISNVFNSLFLTINNLIINLIILKLQSTDKDSQLAREYLMKYDPNLALGSIAKLGEQTLKHTAKLADKGIETMGTIGETAIQATADVGSSSIGAVGSLASGMTGGNENIIENIKSELKNLTSVNYLFEQMMQKLNNISESPEILDKININTPFGDVKSFVKKIVSDVYTFMYLNLDTQPKIVNQVYETEHSKPKGLESTLRENPKDFSLNEQKGGFIPLVIAGVGSYIAYKKIEEAINKSPETNPTGFFASFIRSKESLKNLPSNKPPTHGVFDKVLEKNPKINELVDKVLEREEEENEENEENEDKRKYLTYNNFYKKYLKYKSKYLNLRDKLNM
jgi:hypothetical protein